MKTILVLSALAAVAALSSAGSPLDLYAESKYNGVDYTTTFTLRLTNGDSSWTPGQGWGWIVFSDFDKGPFYDRNTQFYNDSFVGNAGSFVGGPWTGFETTSGDHVGPTLSQAFDMWTPTQVGQTVRWSGRSNVALPDDAVWSALLATSEDKTVDRKSILKGTGVENLNPVPEPATFAAVGVGLLALRRRKRAV